MTNDSSANVQLYETIPDHLLDEWRVLHPYLWYSAPEVELQGDIITLHWGYEPLVAKVDECNFRIGRPWKMKNNSRKVKRLFSFGTFDLILIDFAPLHKTLFGKIWSYNTVPVGYTEESLAKWNKWNTALGDVLGKEIQK